MVEIGLFALGMVLVPGEVVPLHVFEPRYKELIGECLEADLEFGLVLADEHGLRSAGTRARVVEVLQRFPDGRLDIVVCGGERFRLGRLTSGRSFQTAEIETLADADESPVQDERERVIALYRRVAEIAGEVPDDLEDEPSLSFAVAARLDFGVEMKQKLLELRSERTRLGYLGGLLETAAEALAAAEERRRRAQGNGSAPLG